jgi:chromosome segregation ATPase
VTPPPNDYEDINSNRADIRELQRDMAETKRDIGIFGSLVHRIDATIEKLHELSINISRLLAVHEQRFAQNEEMRKSSNERSLEDKAEIEKKIDNEVKRLEENDEKMMSEFRVYRVESNTHMLGIESKLTRIEKLAWIVTGGAMVVGYLLAETNLLSRFIH